MIIINNMHMKINLNTLILEFDIQILKFDNV